VPREAECDFQCPVTGLEMNGRFRFFAVMPSGHVVSHRAVKEAREVVEELVGGTFPSGKSLAEEGAGVSVSLLPINGTEEEVRALREAKVEALLLKRSKKKKKKTRDSGKIKETALQPKPKQFKAAESMLPKGASKEVYASIFTSSRTEEAKETFLCRSTGARGGQLN